MRGMQVVGSDVFREALAPTIGALRDLAGAVGERAGRHGHQPSASSRAMEEIAVEAQFAARSEGWQEPIRDTHTFGGTTLTARCGHLRSQGQAPQAKPAPGAGTTLDLGPHRDRRSLEIRIAKPI